MGRPTLPTDRDADCSEDFWGWGGCTGDLIHRDEFICWYYIDNPMSTVEVEPECGYRDGDVLRLLLDSDAGTLTAKKNGTLLGTVVPGGLTGDLCWAAAMSEGGDSVRIKPVNPADF